MKFTTTFEHFEKFSKINKDKYDKNETVSMWNSINDKYEAMNIGTLMKYAKEYDTFCRGGTINHTPSPTPSPTPTTTPTTTPNSNTTHNFQ